MSIFNSFLPENPTPQGRSVIRTAVISLLIAIFVVPLYVYFAIQENVWQLYVIAGVLTINLVVPFIMIALVRRSYTQLAISVYFIYITILLLVATILLSGIGIPVATLLVLLVLQIGLNTLSPNAYFAALLISVVAGLIFSLIDALNPSFQYVNPTIEQLSVIAITVAGFVYFFAFGFRFFAFPLRIKLTISFLTVTIISVTVISFIANNATQDALIQAADQALQAAASQTASNIDTFITTNRDAVRIESQLPGFITYLSLPSSQQTNNPASEEIYAVLRALSRKDPVNISSYALLDAQGKVLLDTLATDIGVDESSQDYFQRAVQTGLPYVSPVLFSAATGQSSIYFSSPVRSSAGEVIGLLRIRYDSAILQQLIVRSNNIAGEGSQAVLLDENYIRLADAQSPNLTFTSIAPLPSEQLAELQAQNRLPNLDLAQLSTDLPHFAEALDESLAAPTPTPFTTGSHPDEAPDSERGAVARMSEQPWLVVFFQEQAVFLQPVQAQRQNTLLSATAIATVVILIAVGIAQILANPIANLTAVVQRVAAGDLTQQVTVTSQDEIGTLASTFNTMTSQLRDLFASLEQRVADRTRALETSTEVSRRLSTILDPDELVYQVVDQVKNAFNYYHAHIYLFDDKRENLVMVGGTGEAGRTMLANRHQIPAGRGLVGRAAITNQVVLVSNTQTDSQWLPNPLLPETKSEVAVPITAAGKVLGVLDVQHNIAGGLRQEDADLLQSIANQIAIAIQNARSYEITRRKAEQEAVVNTLAREIQQATKQEEVLRILANGLGQSLNVKSSVVQIKNSALPKQGQN